MRLLFITIFLFGIHFTSIAQCDFEFEYKTISANRGINSGKIILELKGDNSEFDFALVDLTTGEKVSEARNRFVSSGIEIEIFTGLKASSYVLYYYSKECDVKRSIGGELGIIVED